jgi:hypothetical protein
MTSPESGVRWRQASRGLEIAGFGVFLLLTTQGVLPWTFWLDALTFWPVLLVALGLRLVLERVVGAWAALASPLLVIGALAFVAMRDTPSAPLPEGDWRRVEIARPEDAEAWILDVDMAMGQLDVVDAKLPPERLVDGRSLGRAADRVRVDEHRGVPRVKVRGRSGPQQVFVWRRHPAQAWELRIARDLPLRADLDVAFVEGSLDLSHTFVSRVEIDGAFNDLVIVLAAPMEEARIDIEGAFSVYQFVVPDSVPVRLDVDGAFNGIDDRGADSAADTPGYRIHLEGAFNSLSVRSP